MYHSTLGSRVTTKKKRRQRQTREILSLLVRRRWRCDSTCTGSYQRAYLKCCVVIFVLVTHTLEILSLLVRRRWRCDPTRASRNSRSVLRSSAFTRDMYPVTAVERTRHMCDSQGQVQDLHTCCDILSWVESGTEQRAAREEESRRRWRCDPARASRNSRSVLR